MRCEQVFVFSLFCMALSLHPAIGKEDLYKILGVKQDATTVQIKRAFRKLALKYHPDKNKNDKNSQEKFIKIAEAYQILSDKEKRKRYDRFGETGDGKGSGGGFQTFNFDEFFSGFDEAFRAHSGDSTFRHSSHFGQNSGNTDHFFNFNDLFEDSHDFGSFENDDFGFSDSFDSVYDGSFHHFDTRQKYSRQAQQSSDGRSCRTVTQRIGNMMTTHTVCS